MLEREKFPRYHIGESLLPFTFQPLQRLGLIDKMRASAFVKNTACNLFPRPAGPASRFISSTATTATRSPKPGRCSARSSIKCCWTTPAKRGAEVVKEETTVLELLKDGPRVAGVRAQTGAARSWNIARPSRWIAPARRPSAPCATIGGSKDPHLNKIAVWTYYKGAQRDEGIDAGATTVAYVPEKGWFWYIPQHNDMISVGVVAEGKYLTRDGVKAPEAIFKRAVEENQWIKQHLACGEQTGPILTSEYTHHSRHCAMDGLLLVGDAFAFLDPVFSSGVMLALKSGTMAGDEVHKAIVERDFSAGTFRRLRPLPARGRGKHAPAGLCLLPSQIQLPLPDQQISRRRQQRLFGCGG
jgi:hypothetical protein